MTLLTDMLDDVVNRADPEYLSPGQTCQVVEDNDCDCCGQVTPDVYMWAEDSETGEQLWLCEACCEW